MRPWMVTPLLAALVVAGAVLVSTVRARNVPEEAAAQAAPAAEAWAPCVRYGRVECCMRPEDP